MVIYAARRTRTSLRRPRNFVACLSLLSLTRRERANGLSRGSLVRIRSISSRKKKKASLLSTDDHSISTLDFYHFLLIIASVRHITLQVDRRDFYDYVSRRVFSIYLRTKYKQSNLSIFFFCVNNTYVHMYKTLTHLEKPKYIPLLFSFFRFLELFSKNKYFRRWSIFQPSYGLWSQCAYISSARLFHFRSRKKELSPITSRDAILHGGRAFPLGSAR